jgi:oligopeptide transport system ATP-binding protein
MIFQDPWSSLNPRITVRSTLAELPIEHRLREKADVYARCRELITHAGLAERSLDDYPRQLPGRQRQRVAMARALRLSRS